MVISEALTPVALGPDDVPGGLALSDAAGWNQTADDWRLFVSQGRVFGCRDGAGRLVATAAALPYAGGMGWVAMVLVAQEWRHQGLATALMKRCVAYLQSVSVTPVLDATPAGAPAYERLGFEAGFELARWDGLAPAAAPVSPPVREAARDDLAAIRRLDAEASGCDRHLLLADFLRRDGSRAWMTQDGAGFVIARQGLRATQLGPLVAADEASALALLQTALTNLRGRVFLDLPERWTTLVAWLAQNGFARQRPFARMALGPAPIASVHDRLFVLAGPEFG
ncbi:GNAT family N-acetyltransferase [Variovorax terrae]|uniref:GNAT family N-acetyltransferase n=1 Tax=Variovorax terrae TaxID=2923278 RepID=A0A9X1VTI1_9BURK|nr:GNAT family N-acetyltransferase [Variovorax terrae]MCJ0761759.1 GNAT family N-acetyltransferase [Variovorax terrae]